MESVEYSKAVPLYEQAVEAARKALGPFHPSYAVYSLGLADAYAYEGDHPRAEANYMTAIRATIQVYGEVHQYTANV